VAKTIRIACKGCDTKDLSELEPFQGELKKLSENNALKLKTEILELGFSEPVSVWQTEGHFYILNGHQRVVVLKMLKAEGYEIPPLPVSLVDASSYQEAKKKVLALTSQYGQISEEGLQRFLEDAQITLDQAMSEFRFPEIDWKVFNPATPDVIEDIVPEPPDEAITQPGDLWVLGNHRLLCGDSAKAEDVDRLLDGASIHLVNTDPPYNVNVEPRSNTAIAAGIASISRRADLQCQRSTTERGRKDRDRLQKRMHHQAFDVGRGVSDPRKAHKKMRPKDRVLENDFVSDEEFMRLLRAWFGNMARVLLPGRGFYIWGGYANTKNYRIVLEECGLYFAQAIIWVKEHPVMTRKDFMGNHEWAFYGWREGAAHYFNPDIHNATDVWSVKKIPPQLMEHLTAKPVELAVRAMTFSSRPGENVLDLFGGSGSTLIAAEQMGRRAFLMEIDTLYCDVIADRFQRFSGKKAILARTGESPLPMKPREEDMR